MEAESIILQLPDPLGTTVFVTDVQWFHHIQYKKQEKKARDHYLALFKHFFPDRNWE